MRELIKVITVAIFVMSCNGGDSSQISADPWWSEEDRQLIISELERTTRELIQEIDALTNDQWNFKKDTNHWSIAQIVEHLEMQNQLHFRETSVVSYAPQYLQFRSITQGKDFFFSQYSTDTIKGSAQWFLTPRGRYCSIKEAQSAFLKARNELAAWVKKPTSI